MNLVGKIFVFLIFCMSVVFMSFAVMIYATHKNWRDEVLRENPGGPGGKIGWKKQLEDEIAALEQKKEDLEYDIEKAENTDFGTVSSTHRVTSKDKVHTEAEKKIISMMRKQKAPQKSIDAAVEKYRKKQQKN